MGAFLRGFGAFFIFEAIWDHFCRILRLFWGGRLRGFGEEFKGHFWPFWGNFEAFSS